MPRLASDLPVVVVAVRWLREEAHGARSTGPHRALVILKERCAAHQSLAGHQNEQDVEGCSRARCDDLISGGSKHCQLGSVRLERVHGRDTHGLEKGVSLSHDHGKDNREEPEAVRARDSRDKGHIQLGATEDYLDGLAGRVVRLGKRVHSPRLCEEAHDRAQLFTSLLLSLELGAVLVPSRRVRVVEGTLEGVKKMQHSQHEHAKVNPA